MASANIRLFFPLSISGLFCDCGLALVSWTCIWAEMVRLMPCALVIVFHIVIGTNEIFAAKLIRCGLPPRALSILMLV